MSSVAFEGIRQTDAVPAGGKFRVTWARDTFARYSFFPPSALAGAKAVQEIGPAHGFYVVSAPAAAPEDGTFVLDIRTQRSWTGSAAQLASALDRASGFDVTKVRAVDQGESSSDAAGERADAQTEAEKEAASSGPIATLERAGNRFLFWLAIGAGAFLVLTNLGAVRAVGAAIKRGAK